VDQVRVVARGGQGGGGSSALFGRTGMLGDSPVCKQHSSSSSSSTASHIGFNPTTATAAPTAGHHPRAAGGNGAPGGAVVLRATRQLTGLGSIPLHVDAERGGHGGKQWMDGKRGADTVRWKGTSTRQPPTATSTTISSSCCESCVHGPMCLWCDMHCAGAGGGYRVWVLTVIMPAGG
jgi:hypothetical protein